MGNRETMEAKRARALSVLETLAPEYPDTRPLLDFASPFQLLVATVLSAQCTDAMVNRVSPALFARYPTPRDLAVADPGELEELIRPTGFYRSKAAHLRSLAAVLEARFGGAVPATMEELVGLSGVGRKTAGVILSVCFGVPAIIVDTHFSRVARRLDFAVSEDPVRLEREVAELLPRDRWSAASHLLNRHGRRYCGARKPLCADCPARRLCPFR